MLRENGVVVFDDYRKSNTMGVAAAMWEAILNEGLKPIANTDYKLYATWGDPAPLRAEITRRAAESGWCRTTDEIMIRDMGMVYLHRKG